MRKHLLTVTITLCVLNTLAGAQSLTVFNISRTSYPVIKAYVRAVDKDGKRINDLTENDFVITENGRNCKVTLYNCPPETPTNKISAALSVDVSGSMGQVFNGARSVDYAKMTCTNLINAFPMPPSEIALQQCDDRADILHDFTTDRSVLLSAVSKISAGGGNNFDEHLLNPYTGLLSIAAQGKYQRNAILCSDAYWYPLSPPAMQKCLDICSKYGIRFYALLFNDQSSNGSGVRESLQKLADATGGWLREGIITVDGANQLAQELTGELSGSLPCAIEWESANHCERSVEIIVSIPRYGLTTTFTFENPLARGYLEVSPYSVRFGRVTPPLTGQQPIELTAHDGDILIKELSTTDPAITIKSPSLPFTIFKGATQEITVVYTPRDSAFISASLYIVTDYCYDSLGLTVPISAGLPPMSALKLVRPKSGEQFVVGEDTVIEWTGVSPAYPVKLKYSTDGGSTYSIIADSAVGLRYKWRVPLPPSTQCRIVGSLVTSSLPASIDFTLVNRYRVFDSLGLRPSYAEVSPDHRQIMVSAEGVHLFDAATGAHQYSTTGIVTGAAFPPTYINNGTMVIGCSGSTIFALRASGGSPGIIWTKTSMPFNSFAVSPDHTMAATSSVGWATEVWRTSDGSLLHELYGHLGDALNVAFDRSSAWLATVGKDNTARIWNLTTGMESQKLDISGIGSAVVFHPNGFNLITTTQSDVLEHWTIGSQTANRTQALGVALPNRLAITASGSQLYVGSSQSSTGKVLSDDGLTYTNALNTNDAFDNWNVRPPMTKNGELVLFKKFGNPKVVVVWSMSKGQIVGELSHPLVPLSATFSDDERYIVTTTDREAFLWEMSNFADSGQKVDTTKLFSVVAPQALSLDVDMGAVLVGKKKDSVISGFITNTGTYRVRVDSVVITGANAGDFALQSTPQSIIEVGDQAPVEFSFLPSAAGIRNAAVTIYTRSGELQQSISGQGVNPVIQTIGNVIDFGIHPIGNLTDSIIDVAVKNVGSSPVDIISSDILGPDTEQFSIINGGGNFTLAPNETRSMTLRFAPQYIGRASSNIGFVYAGVGSPAVLRLFGQGIGGTVYIPDDSGSPGDVVNIPLLLKGVKTYIQNDGATKFTAELSFDATVLTPVDAAARGTIRNGIQTVSLSTTWGGTSDTLATIAMKVGLGAYEKSMLGIPTFKWLDDLDKEVPLAIEVIPGTFTLTGLCNEGGKRLIEPKGQVSLSIQPNPVVDRQITIRYETIESGSTSFAIYNALGELIHASKEELKPGAHKQTLNVADLPTGMYFCVLRTPSIHLERTIFVTK